VFMRAKRVTIEPRTVTKCRKTSEGWGLVYTGEAIAGRWTRGDGGDKGSRRWGESRKRVGRKSTSSTARRRNTAVTEEKRLKDSEEEFKRQLRHAKGGGGKKTLAGMKKEQRVKGRSGRSTSKTAAEKRRRGKSSNEPWGAYVEGLGGPVTWKKELLTSGSRPRDQQKRRSIKRRKTGSLLFLVNGKSSFHSGGPCSAW